MVGGLNAIRLLAERRDLLRAGAASSGSGGDCCGLRRVGDGRAGDRRSEHGGRYRCSGGRLAREWSARQVGGLGRTGLKAMNVDDQAPGIGKQKGRVVGDRTYVEHNPGDVVGELRCTDAFEEAVVDDFDGLAVQPWVQARAVEIKVDAVRTRARGLPDRPPDLARSMAMRVYTGVDQWRIPLTRETCPG